MNELRAALELFGESWLAGAFAGVTLAICSVFVVARRQVFLGAAIAQSSTLGCALALVLGTSLGLDESHWLRGDGAGAALAALFGVLAALVAAGGAGQSKQREQQERREARTGWVFLAAASLAILVVSNSPHGIEEVHRLVSSSMLGAGRTDVYQFAALLLVTIVLVMRFGRGLVLVALDEPMAAAVGVPVRAVVPLAFAWIGVCTGLAIRCTGMLFAFGCLVLPALIAARLSRRVLPLYWIAPLIALGAAALGFLLAHGLDLPPAQVAIALLSLALPLAAIARRLGPAG